MSAALEELDDLLASGLPLAAWEARHAIGGRIDVLWEECSNARLLVAIAGRIATAWRVAGAAAGCARLVVDLYPTEEALHAVRYAERWLAEHPDDGRLAGDADSDAWRPSLNAYGAIDAAKDALEAGQPADAASFAAEAAAYAAACTVGFVAPGSPPEGAIVSARSAAAASDLRCGARTAPPVTHERPAGRADRLAAIVRTHLACPSLDALATGSVRRPPTG